MGGYNNNGYNRSYNNNGYNRSYNNNGYNRSYNNNGGNNRQKKKRSGAKFRSSYVRKSTGEVVNRPMINAWNYSRRRGMLSIIASPHKKKSKTKSKTQQCWMVKGSFPTGEKWFIGFYNTVTQKLTIPELGMVVNPNAPNGGYFGKFYRSKN